MNTINPQLIAEISSLSNRHLLALERSFYDMISTGRKGLRRLLDKSAPIDESSALLESILSRQAVYRKITDELIHRFTNSAIETDLDSIIFSTRELPPGVG